MKVPSRSDEKKQVWTMSFATNLSTQLYLSEDTSAAELHSETGWGEVRTGLNRIIFSYLLSFSAGIVAGFIGWMVYAQVKGLKEVQELGDVSTAIYVACGVLFFMILGSFSLMVRGMWTCLMKVPERENAKWWMFACMLCFLMGPTLNFIAPFLDTKKSKASSHDEKIATTLYRSAQHYPKQLALTTLEPTAYFSLAGSVASWLSGLFFLFFLRGVARCFQDTVRTRLTELLIAFTIFLFAGTIYFIMELAKLEVRLDLLLGLAGGWLLAVLWYFVLLVSISAMIAGRLSRRRSPLY
jgi:hypothetical protein